MTPDILIVGHTVKDVAADGWRPGGSILFASCQAQRLGLRVAAVTSCSADISPAKLLPDVQWHVVGPDQSLEFENTYSCGRRSQILHGSTSVLTIDAVPAAWKTAPLVLLAPVFHDVSPALAAQLARPGSFVACGAQGWLRQRRDGRVLPGPLPERPDWLGSDVVFLSEEDVCAPDSLDAWAALFQLVIMTRGYKGCSIWSSGQRSDVPALPAQEVDPTGAGDVFAVAFLFDLSRSGNPNEAARFASAAAGLSLEKGGLDGIGNLNEIESRRGLAA